jgi:glycosyltransferase involved in cell wall biosynthesis
MKLLFLADSTRVQTRNWIKYFNEKGYEVELVSHTPLADFDNRFHLLTDCKDKNGRLKNFWYLNQRKNIKEIIKKSRPDMMQALYTTNFGFAGAMTGFHPFVLTALGADILFTPRKNIFYQFITHYALKRADLIVADAPHLADAVSKFKVKKSKIVTFGYHLDSPQFKFTPRDVKSSRPRFTILSTRNLNKNSNLQTIIKTIPFVIREIPNVWFVFICNEETKNSLSEMAKRLNVLEHIAFPGEQPYSEMSNYYQSADIYISLAYRDGIPQSLLEAIACSAFPVVSKTPENETLIHHGLNGFCVEPNQPESIAQNIIQAIESAELREQAAIINLQKVQNLPTLDQNLNQLEYKYFELLKKTSG